MLLLVTISSCQNRNNKTFNEDVDALRITYEKKAFEVERQWITLRDENSSIKISAFIHLPVIADTLIKQEILPVKAWQRKHFEEISLKVGSQIANRAAKGIFDGVVNGKSSGQKFPMLIFGPGLGWLSTDYYNILLPLVRQGIIVVCISATPISKTVYFPEGDFISVQKTKADYTENAEYLSFATNELLNLSKQKNSILFSKIDIHRVVAGGHSVSGASSLLAGVKNRNIKAIINLDGDVNGEISKLQPFQSILYITSQPQGVSDTLADNWLNDKSEKRRDDRFLFNSALAHTSFRIKVPNMYHLDFLDIAVLKDSMEKKVRDNRFGEIKPALANTIVVDAIKLFIESDFKDRNEWKIFNNDYKNIYLDIRQ